MDGFWTGGETALKLGQSETDRAAALTIQVVGTIHLIANIIGDSRIKRRFKIRELIIGSVGMTLRKERCAIELKQLFFDHATHHVGDVDLMCAFAESAIEAIAIQQGEPDLEVFFFAVMWSGG